MHNFKSITAFTICSNNYLAQAKTLGDALLRFNPSYKFIIFLVDSLTEEIDYSFFNPFEVIPVNEINITDFEGMLEKYDITELNTAVKPFIFDYLFRGYNDINSIIYLDPDIVVYERFTDLENYLLEYNIIITPHFFTPIFDNLLLSEPGILNTGLYNLGFIAVSRSGESQKFLNWWMIKLKDQCFIDFKNGLFVDQLWINFVPLYYEKVFILKHLGYNIAYWNLHERNVTCSQGKYSINNKFPLVFYHFSGFDFNNPSLISKYQTRYTFDQRPDVVSLFKDYHNKVVDNNFAKYSSLPCYYIQLKKKLHAANQPKRSLSIVFKEKLKRLISGKLP